MSVNLKTSMDKLLQVLLELRCQSQQAIILEHYVTSKDITKVEDLTSRIRHLVTLMGQEKVD